MTANGQEPTEDSEDNRSAPGRALDQGLAHPREDAEKDRDPRPVLAGNLREEIPRQIGLAEPDKPTNDERGHDRPVLVTERTLEFREIHKSLLAFPMMLS